MLCSLLCKLGSSAESVGEIVTASMSKWIFRGSWGIDVFREGSDASVHLPKFEDCQVLKVVIGRQGDHRYRYFRKRLLNN